jgi:hypothetical protein
MWEALAAYNAHVEIIICNFPTYKILFIVNAEQISNGLRLMTPTVFVRVFQ